MKKPIQEASKDIYLRPAQIGDICILIETADKAEISLLLHQQKILQSRFGGQPIQPVHLTCQRFECQERHMIERLVRDLEFAMRGVSPFIIIPLSFETLYVPVRQTNILKWSIQITNALKNFVELVENVLQKNKIEPLYRPGFVSSLVSALRGIPSLSHEELSRDIKVPSKLFTAQVLTLYRIDGPNEFEALARINIQSKR